MNKMKIILLVYYQCKDSALCNTLYNTMRSQYITIQHNTIQYTSDNNNEKKTAKKKTRESH